jgi:hypothetical protein
MLMPTVDAEPPRDDGRQGPERWRSRPAWVALGTVAALAADAVTERYDPALGVIMFVCNVGFPAVLALVVVSVILFGDEDRKNRAFRLLRWARDKPEPPGPPELLAKSRASGRKAHWRSSRRTGRRPKARRTRGRGARR